MVYAVLFAGGVGKRMYTSSIPKQFIEVEGMPILIHTVLAFEKNKDIDAISVVCVDSWRERFQEMLAEYNVTKVKWVVPGAETGQQSIYNGINAIYQESKDANHDIVLINDGVRPFVTDDVITNCIESVKKFSSAIVVCPVPETIVKVNEQDDITEIPDRSKWYLSKAPQGFILGELIQAHHRAMEENRYDCTNSAELMRRYGHSLHVIYDTPDNIKVTTPIDINLMKVILQEKRNRND